MKRIFPLLLQYLAKASEHDFQLYFPGDRAEAFDGAEATFRLEDGPTFATCLWFKSTNIAGGELIRFTDSWYKLILSIALSDNKILISTANDKAEISMSDVELRDFRWHQICLDCKSDGCTSFLDGHEAKVIQNSLPSLIGSEITANLGYGAGFEGAIQRIQIGSGPDEIRGTTSKTVCGVEYRTLNPNLKLNKVGAGDWMITRPLHSRDYESTCNDLLSIDCGLDMISVSISHLHLKSIGEIENKFPRQRLSLMENCKNFTSRDYTVFTIHPIDACGSAYESTQQDRTIRNSVLSYANDGQVFTADFQCQYPIDVTAVDYVEPIESQQVKIGQKVVSVGLSRFDTNDFKKRTEEELDMEVGEIIHLAAITPDEVDRDLRVMVKSCYANVKDEIVSLLSDFGCYQSDHSYVYANGDSSSARFSLKVPSWVIEFRCELAVCDWGDDCAVKCGNNGPRIRRDLKNADEVKKAEEEEKKQKEKAKSEDIDGILGTTDSPYIPMGTTANTIIEEIWDEQRNSLEGISVTEVVFGPLHWPSATVAPQTTVLPDLETTVLPTDDRVYTTESDPGIILDEESADPDRDIVSTLAPEVSTQFDDLEEIKFVEDIQIIKEGEIPTQNFPPWTTMGIILLSAAAFIIAFIALVLKWYKSKTDRKLINASY